MISNKFHICNTAILKASGHFSRVNWLPPDILCMQYFMGRGHEKHKHTFWATICKTVRPMLSDRRLSVCDVGVLWPKG